VSSRSTEINQKKMKRREEKRKRMIKMGRTKGGLTRDKRWI
jgi:hypothetical protein